MNLEIANRLVELRRAEGLSQEDLASRLGVSRQAVSKWERAESSPDTDNLIMLAKLYGVSLDELLLSGGTEKPSGPAAYAKAETHYDERDDILDTADRWDEAERAAQKKKLLNFPYPVLVVIVYLIIGFSFGLWHPGWLLFLTIPFYYCWADSK